MRMNIAKIKQKVRLIEDDNNLNKMLKKVKMNHRFTQK